MLRVATISLISSLFLLGCDAGRTGTSAQAQNSSPSPCSVLDAGRPLPDVVRETSGLAQSRRDASLFYTHNDRGGQAELFVVDTAGRLVQRVTVTGATMVDWEDIEAGPCDEGTCLYVADIGDNSGARSTITIYRVPEPVAGADQSVAATALTMRYPLGPQDAESIFVLPSKDLYVVSKGRHGPITLYRYPAGRPPNTVVTLERVRDLFPRPRNNVEWVTSATATPDGRWVGIRTSKTLYLYDANALIGTGDVTPTAIDLGILEEAQGEAIVIGNDGTVWLTSEAASRRRAPSWSRMKCTLPG